MSGVLTADCPFADKGALLASSLIVDFAELLLFTQAPVRRVRGPTFEGSRLTIDVLIALVLTRLFGLCAVLNARSVGEQVLYPRSAPRPSVADSAIDIVREECLG